MGSGGVAIAALFIVICLEVPFSDGLGEGRLCGLRGYQCVTSGCNIMYRSGTSKII